MICMTKEEADIILNKLDDLEIMLNGLIDKSIRLEKDLKCMTLRYEKASEELRARRHGKKHNKMIKSIKDLTKK